MVPLKMFYDWIINIELIRYSWLLSVYSNTQNGQENIVKQFIILNCYVQNYVYIFVEQYRKNHAYISITFTLWYCF